MSGGDFEIEQYSEPLDLFSTSASVALVLPSFARCQYGAPYFAFQRGGKHYAVVQGCCNHWECQRCGEMVAKRHYGRIIEGSRQISKESELYFITVTCRGLDCSVEEAFKNYGKWTHRFLRTCQQRHVRHGGQWFYAQVTEAQKRGHPHSHILTTFSPHDLVDGCKSDWVTSPSGVRRELYVEALRSDWLQEMVCKAGLGEQYDISVVEEVEGAARYVAKYLFKDSQFGTHFPKGWKRVRYSQSWPKLERKKTDAFVLLSRDDWYHLASLALVVDAERGDAADTARYFLSGHDVFLDVIEPKVVDMSSKRLYAEPASQFVQH